MEYMDKLREKYSPINDELRKEFASGPIQNGEVNKISSDPNLRDLVRRLLGLFDHLAVGVHSEVFDIQLLNRMSGSYLIAIYERYKPYIEKARSLSKNRLLYIEYEELIGNIKALREKQK